MSQGQAPISADAEQDSRVKVSAAHRAQLIAIYEFVQAQNLGCTNPLIFSHCGVSRRTGYRILSDAGYGGVPVPRRQSKQQAAIDATQPTIDFETLFRLRLWKEAGGLPIYAATWKHLAVRAGLLGERKVSWRALKDKVAAFEYDRHDRQRSKVVDPDARLVRCNQARARKIWVHDDWKKVRFSGVGIFGRGEGVLNFHCWAQVGWDCKSDLVFLNVQGTEGRSVGPQVYIKEVLEPHVLPLIAPDYILHEDDDSGHDAASDSVVERWKMEHGLQYYISSSESPDLSILKNCWRPIHHFVDRNEECDEITLRQRILEAWNEVSQRWINEMVLTMPQRVDDVLDSGGQRTKWISIP